MRVPLPTTVLIAPAANPASAMATTSPTSIAASSRTAARRMRAAGANARGRARTGQDDVAGHGRDANTVGCARPGSNRRPSPCKGDALPLSYARVATLATKRAGPAAGDDGGHGADGQGRGGHRWGVG